MKKSLVLMILLFTTIIFAQQQKVEKWDIYEAEFNGPDYGNPFVGITLSAEFHHSDSTHAVYEPEGFYDGEGIFKIRFMPDLEGEWTFKTHSNKKELDGLTGEFTCIAPKSDSHGPVVVRNKYHFAYADGKPYFPFGTTCYQWCFESPELQNQTLETLKNSPFNKVRFLVLPNYTEDYVEGPRAIKEFPFEGEPENKWDFSRFNTTFFKAFEKNVERLRELGIEADVILFRPYDNGKFGFDTMDRETNDRYLRYVIARLGAYSNVWWSLANENSFIRHLTAEDWDHYFKVVRDKDPYHHLRSIHNAGDLYDYTKPWVTHVSLQYYNVVRNFGVCMVVRDIYGKPLVNDEINYEGNIASRWGQLSGEEMTRRFWIAYIGGSYATHGEAIEHESKIDWISEGGVLRGTSAERIGFLREIVESGPQEGLQPLDHYYLLNAAGKYGEYYLYYFAEHTPEEWEFKLPDEGLENGMKFKAELIDTWNMTITPINKVYTVEMLNRYNYIDKDHSVIKFPKKPYMALRLTRIQE